MEFVSGEHLSCGVVEGPEKRRLAKSASNILRAPKSVCNTPPSVPKCFIQSLLLAHSPKVETSISGPRWLPCTTPFGTHATQACGPKCCASKGSISLAERSAHQNLLIHNLSLVDYGRATQSIQLVEVV